MVLDGLRDRVTGRDRIAVYVDGPNIIRKEFDLDLDDFRERIQEEGRIAVAKVFLNQFAPEKLVEAVASQGFDPVLGVGEVEDESSDVDVYLATAAMEAVFDDSIDTIVIVTRDADFLPLIQKARERGKRVVVAGMDSGFSTAIQNAADEVIVLD